MTPLPLSMAGLLWPVGKTSWCTLNPLNLELAMMPFSKSLWKQMTPKWLLDVKANDGVKDSRARNAIKFKTSSGSTNCWQSNSLRKKKRSGFSPLRFSPRGESTGAACGRVRRRVEKSYSLSRPWCYMLNSRYSIFATSVDCKNSRFLPDYIDWPPAKMKYKLCMKGETAKMSLGL